MPFTFAHPAAILPFRYFHKRWISMTGLIIGSISPDFEYFIRMRIHSIYSHKWFGLLWFDISVSIVLAFVYHLIVRDAFIDNLPRFLAKRMLRFKHFNWSKYFKKNFWIVIISVAAGAATHILWDGLTHKNVLFAKKDGWFDQEFIIYGYVMPRYKMLQHLSTLIGGVIVLFAIWRLPLSSESVHRQSVFPYWLSVATVALIVLLVHLFTGLDWSRPDNAGVTLISGVMIGLVLTPKILLLRKYVLEIV